MAPRLPQPQPAVAAQLTADIVMSKVEEEAVSPLPRAPHPSTPSQTPAPWPMATTPGSKDPL
eukprot:11551616-Prorocentrum_lima.AAC.1